MINLFALIIIFISLKLLCNNKTCNHYMLILTITCYLIYHFIFLPNIENFKSTYSRITIRKPNIDGICNNNMIVQTYSDGKKICLPQIADFKLINDKFVCNNPNSTLQKFPNNSFACIPKDADYIINDNNIPVCKDTTTQFIRYADGTTDCIKKVDNASNNVNNTKIITVDGVNKCESIYRELKDGKCVVTQKNPADDPNNKNFIINPDGKKVCVSQFRTLQNDKCVLKSKDVDLDKAYDDAIRDMKKTGDDYVVDADGKRKSMGDILTQQQNNLSSSQPQIPLPDMDFGDIDKKFGNNKYFDGVPLDTDVKKPDAKKQNTDFTIPSNDDWNKDFEKDFNKINLSDMKQDDNKQDDMISKIEAKINQLQTSYQDALKKQIMYQRKNQKQYDGKYENLSKMLQYKIDAQVTNLNNLKEQITKERDVYGKAIRTLNNSVNKQLQNLREDLLSSNRYMSFDDNSVWIK